MERFSVNVLWLTSLVLPSLLFLVFNKFGSRPVTFARAVLATLVGWQVMLAYAVAAQSLTARDPSEVNGAALAFASVFGWVVPAIVVALTWLVAWLLSQRQRPNKSSKPTPLRGAA